jgi:hypothetical protein
MPLVLADRVQETTSSSGTGTINLAGAISGYQSFISGIGGGNSTYYCIYDNTAQIWEVGYGTVTAGAPDTLSRTTVFANSSGTTAPLNLPGNPASVFCVYTAAKTVNLDPSGNVTPLGTIASGTWQGSTVGVAYGGTGVTASSGPNSVVLRDANQNIRVNSVAQTTTKTTAAAGTTVLTVASSPFQILVGTTTETYQLPDATVLPTGASYIFDNDSTGNLYIVNNASGAVDTVAPGGYTTVFLEDNSTVAGEWGRFGMIPSEVNWGTNNLDLGGSTVITNGIWHGSPIQPSYGGTGLTTFTGANYALYSTSASTLTAGTLPVPAGGTGATTFTANGILFGNGVSAIGATTAPSAAGTFLQWNGTNYTWNAPTGQDPSLPFYFTFDGDIITTSYGYAVADGVYINQTFTITTGDVWVVGVEGEIYVTETATPNTTYQKMINTDEVYNSDVRFFDYTEISPYNTVTCNADMEICEF